MNRRVCKLLTLWIVPLLIARALIPAGFMLSADANGLSLVFCSGSVPATAVVSDAVQHHQHGEHHSDSGDQLAADHQDHGSAAGLENSLCPFSFAASAAAMDARYLASDVVIKSDPVFPFLSAPSFSIGPLRADRIRGPPALLS